MTARHLLTVTLLASAAISLYPQGHSQAASQDQSQPTQRPAPPINKKQTAATHDSAPEDEGDRIFQQNCSRCHRTPDGFSSRISGTIVRHMRVRASLSQHDEEELLRFLNP
jgi:mono/diheme cytochrome c family protein